jgi:HlyD family secretion protein
MNVGARSLAAFRRRFERGAPLRARLAALARAAARHASRRRLAVAAAALGFALLAGLGTSRFAGETALTASVEHGTLVVRLTESGVLKPASSTTYRSPLGGREAEIVVLVAEGTLVGDGDLLVRLDTTDLERERARAVRELRQAEVDLKLAEADREEGAASVHSVTHGQRSLELDEARTQLAMVERRAERLAKEYEALASLRERGFVTQDELEEAGFGLEQARAERELARRKLAALEAAQPRDRLRAELLLAQKEAQHENVRARVREAAEQLRALEQQIEGCRVYARAPGLVVHEDYLGGGQRRKVRVGDRVTGSHGLVTIPEVARMVVEASVPEFQVHRVQTGQAASVRLDAFPDRSFAGRVARVGTLARTASERSEEKRFDIVVELADSAPELRPEMTARVDIAVAEKPAALLVPVNAVFERAGAHVYHVVGLFGPRTRRVILGDANELHAEVISGLAAGERVSLLDVGGGTAPPPAAGGGAAAAAGRLKAAGEERSPAALGQR